MKINKFLTAAMVVALAVFASCSTENDNGTKPDGNGNGTDLNAPTYATFKFNLASKSRATADFYPDAITPDDAADAAFGFNDLRLVIFDATSKACELNEVISSAEGRTVLLSAGTKKIFVFANTAALNDAGGTNNPSDFNTRIATYTKGGTKSLTDFYAEVFSAGTPQNLVMGRGETVDPRTGTRTFLYNALSDRVSVVLPTLTGCGIPASNTNAIDYKLKANVTKDEANGTTGTPDPSLTGESNNNSFVIQLEYMSAKARLLLASDVRSKALAEDRNNDGVADGTVVGDVKYSIKNLAQKTNYVQKVEGGIKKSYYYNMFTNSNHTQADFDPHFDYSAIANEEVKTAPATTTSPDFIFVPENNHPNILRGQSSYYAMNAIYEPGVVVNSVTYNELTSQVVYTNKKLAECGVYNGEGAKDYIYVTSDIKDGDVVLVTAGTYFKNFDLLLKAIWTAKYKNNDWATLAGTTTQRDEAKAFLPGVSDPKTDKGQPFLYFVGASSWYRIDIGEGTGTQNTEFGVLRGNAYTGVVSAINGPGLPSEKDLTENPGDPVKASTYISITITAAKWTPIDWSGSVE